MNRSDITLLLTRPEEASRRFLTEAEACLGPISKVVVSPLMRIETLALAAPVLAPEDDLPDLILTSQNGAEAAARLLPRGGLRAWCVGARTAEAARRAGFVVAATEPDAEALLSTILAAQPGAPFLHLSGQHRRGQIVERLIAAGLRGEARAVYDQVAQPLSPEAVRLLSQPGDIIAPLFSPRSARLLAAEAKGRVARLHVVAISPATAAEWAPHSDEMRVIAGSSDAKGMIYAMGRLFDADRSA